MDVKEFFDKILENLKISNIDDIRGKRDEITKALNKSFRGTQSKSDNRLIVGSWGRDTAIDGVSDLDMLYILPKPKYNDYKDDPYKALKETKEAIQKHYSTTEMRVDRLVVVVCFTNYKFEVQPVFEADDGSFLYPDTYSSRWKKTMPREEIKAISKLDTDTNKRARSLCKLVRSWRQKNGIEMNGLLIDTLVWKFLIDNESSWQKRIDELLGDFFLDLSHHEDRNYCLALGSNQQVKIKKPYQKAAYDAYALCQKAIEADTDDEQSKKWRKILGGCVPKSEEYVKTESNQFSFRNTEEFIEDFYYVEILYNIFLDCKVTQNGFRPDLLKNILATHRWLCTQKSLEFFVNLQGIPKPYIVKWKVKNCGREAEKRDNIRGQIIKGATENTLKERTDFLGEHYVECYVIKNGTVVARERIEVPIRTITR